MTDHLMYRISLENTTYFDFGREKWIKNLFLFLSDPAFSDRSIHGEVIKTGRWDLKKGDRDRLIEVNITVGKKFGTSNTDRLIRGDR